jgi:hypothetical protein
MLATSHEASICICIAFTDRCCEDDAMLQCEIDELWMGDKIRSRACYSSLSHSVLITCMYYHVLVTILFKNHIQSFYLTTAYTILFSHHILREALLFSTPHLSL